MDIAIAVATLLLASLVHATFGFGTALVAMPILVIAYGLPVATPVVGLAALTTTCIVLRSQWRKVDIHSAKDLLVASLLGLPVGLVLLVNFPGPWLERLLGLLIIAYSGAHLVGYRYPRIESRVLAYVFGFVSGVLGGAYNTNAPPVVVYAALSGWDPAKFRATLQGFFLPSALLIVVGHGVAGLWSTRVFELVLWSLPAIVLSNFIGARIAAKIEPARYLRFVYLILAVLGGAMLF